MKPKFELATYKSIRINLKLKKALKLKLYNITIHGTIIEV